VKTLYQTKIMVVEDERIVALNLKQRLIRMGYEVTAVVTSGRKALAAITENRPDIVLMDIHIDGDMDGIATAAAIPPDLHLPVVYLTAYSEEATLERARATQPYGYLLKPFSERELHATMQMVLERRRTDGLLRESEARLEALVTARTAELVASNAQLQEQISVRLRTEEALYQAQKMEAIGQLTGGVAHDFNNLLTPIIGSLDMLQRKGVGGDREQRLIAGALTSAERAKTVVQRLLAFARRQPLQPCAVNIASLLDGMAELLTTASAAQIRVIVDVDADTPAAHADQTQLEMAILNLIVNARDAMPKGGVLTITTRGEEIAAGHPTLEPGSYVNISIADTGMGMDEATLARAVEPFFSTKAVGHGTGLGLSMVHGLASQLGGELKLSSQLGKGVVADLWLPVSADTAKLASQRLPGAVSDTAQGAALLVDDEDLVRASTAEMLTELGYQVIDVCSAFDALALFDDGASFDLLLTDHVMPGMSGVDLVRQLRLRYPDLRALIISGYADVDSIAPDLPRLMKPFRQADLADCLASLAAAAAA
jgi:signal transduction histidine kinase